MKKKAVLEELTSFNVLPFHAVTKLIITFSKQAQLFKYLSVFQLLLHSQAHILRLRIRSHMDICQFSGFLHSNEHLY